MSALFAQQQTAILVHSDNSFNAYYGNNALIQAVAAAQHGETINLSGGSFFSCNINKNLTIRGNGINGPIAERTYINNRMDASDNTSPNRRLTIEGVYFTNGFYTDSVYDEVTFNNCYISRYQRGWDFVRRLNFINCYVMDFSSGDGGVNDSVYITAINSYVYYNHAKMLGHFYNCVVRMNGENHDWMYSPIQHFQNCVIYGSCHYDYYNGLTPYIKPRIDHCLVISTTDTNLFSNVALHSGDQNYEVSFADVFETFRGGDIDGHTSFALTSYAQNHYLGSDSTQVGIYGGVRPWTDALTYPKITGMTVDHQTTSAGLLGVDVQIRQGE